MIIEWANLALILSAFLAGSQAVIGFWSAHKEHQGGMVSARYTAVGQCLLTLLSFSLLAVAFLHNDWSVRYVTANSNEAMPWIYRLCATWGAHEGSMLLWVLILTFWMSAVAIFGRRLPLPIQVRVLAVLALIALGFDAFILSASSPFVRLLSHIPTHGVGLNPLLQDPGLVSHPPILYLGYVGFAVAFAFAITGLLTGRLDSSWARWVRPWTLFAWAALTAGIVLGSWWAYRELGWGGFWFWDPVENASFMPWLAGTALIHSLQVTQKKGLCRAWTVLLAIVTFSLSLLGTFLVRSGILISVHAFAVDPERGAYILAFLAVVIGFSLLLYALKSKPLAQSGLIQPVSRSAMLLLNNMLLFTALLTVVLGTLYPLLIDLFSLDKISVGAPYFNSVFIPLMWPVMFFMGLAAFVPWEGSPVKASGRLLSALLVLVAVISAVALYCFTDVLSLWNWVSLTLIVWLFVASLLAVCYPFQQSARLRWRALWEKTPMLVAHLGLAVCALGILFACTLSQHALVNLKINERVELPPYAVQLIGVRRVQGPNYVADEADLLLLKNEKLLTHLHPQLRRYAQSGMQITKTDQYETAFEDLYVALGGAQPGGGFGVRFYDKAFISWIWVGGFMMVAGGLIAALRKRKKKGAKHASSI